MSGNNPLPNANFPTSPIPPGNSNPTGVPPQPRVASRASRRAAREAIPGSLPPNLTPTMPPPTGQIPLSPSTMPPGYPGAMPFPGAQAAPTPGIPGIPAPAVTAPPQYPAAPTAPQPGPAYPGIPGMVTPPMAPGMPGVNLPPSAPTPGVMPAPGQRRSRRQRADETGIIPQLSLSIPGTKRAPDFQDLLGQQVSSISNDLTTSLRGATVGKANGVVGLAVGKVPPPEPEYPIPYVPREHSTYYHNFEIATIMQAILDPYHARQVLARIISLPRWYYFVMALVFGLCGAAVSILNGFLTVIIFIWAIGMNLFFTNVYANRTGAGRFFDPLGFKVVWSAGFAAPSVLGIIILCRAYVPQPWLAIGGALVIGSMAYAWGTWNQNFQVKRLLNTTIEGTETQRKEVQNIADAVAAVTAQVEQQKETSTTETWDQTRLQQATMRLIDENAH